jgi:nitrate reductase NapAB chaperone NapD
MSIASVVVEIRNGASDEVLSCLARIPNISVFGMTDSQIVTVIEGDDAAVVENVLKEMQSIENVIGVYPVFVGENA